MPAWLKVCALLGVGAALASWLLGLAPPAGPALVWKATSWPARPWTLWTSAWVHTSAGSLAGNLLAVLALAVVGASLRAGVACAAALLLAWPLGTLGLLFWPKVATYSGLGGPIHAGAMVLWSLLFLHSRTRAWSLAVLGAVALKLLIEAAWVQPVAFDPSWGFNVVYAAHLTGAVAGALCGLLANLAWPARGAASANGVNRP